MGVNRLIEPDKNPLRAKSESGAIRLIMVGNFVNFCVSLFARSGLDAARSETTVAGLGLVLAFLQPEKKCVYRF